MTTTIYDIARAAGVSHTAVSAVLGGRAESARIGAGTAARIVAVASKLGYERNDLAQAVVRGHTRLVAMIAREPSHEYIGHMLHGALTAAAERNYIVHVQSVADEIHLDLGEAYTRCRAYRPRGIYICAVDWMVDGAVPKALTSAPRSVHVVHSHCSDGMPGIGIECDEAMGMALAVDHLRALGHRRIAFLGGPLVMKSVVERRRGFEKAMRRAALAVDKRQVVCPGWSWEDAAPSVKALLQTRPRPTAMVCANDGLAVIAMQVAREQGLDVPRDLSLIGCSDELLGHFVRPMPTTIVQPFRQIGREAINLILDLAEGVVDVEDAARTDRRLPVRLEERGTTAAPATKPR